MPQAGLEHAIPMFRLAEIVTPYSQKDSFGSDKKNYWKSEVLQCSLSVLLTSNNDLTGPSKMHNST